MDFKKLDLYLIVVLERNNGITLKEISIKSSIDKSLVFKSLKKLKEYGLVITDNNRPMNYYLNKYELEKWKRKN